MMFATSKPLYLLLALALASCVNAMYSSSDDVVVLTASNFKEEVLKSDALWLVEFYAPWCGHCKNLTPEWKKAAKALKGVVKVGAVDATEHSSLGGKYGVQGYPTIKVFGADKKKAEDYNGGRDAKAIVDSALKSSSKMVKDRMGGKKKSSGSSSSSSGSKGKGKDDVVTLTASNFDALVMDSKDMWMVEFYAPWCGHCKNLAPEWAGAATALKRGAGVKLGAVDVTAEEALGQRFAIKGFPTIYSFPPGPKSDSGASKYEGGRTKADIVAYAEAEMDRRGVVQTADEMTSASVLQDACGEEGQLCVLASLPHILDSGKAGREEYLATLAAAAKSLRGSPLSFLWMEGGVQADLENALGMTFGYPALALISPSKGRFSLLRGVFDSTSVSSFVSSVLRGKTATDPLPSAPLKSLIVPVTAWDGEDAGSAGEELSLEELLGDDWRNEL